uniref:Uncharacterized protein n=1 Tax=Magallana gigas TaxID=29159 RepID=K1RU37_MAGGI
MSDFHDALLNSSKTPWSESGHNVWIGSGAYHQCLDLGALNPSDVSTLNTIGLQQCMRECLGDRTCLSLNYWRNDLRCTQHRVKTGGAYGLVPDSECIYIERQDLPMITTDPKQSWPNARAACQTVGADLAIIDVSAKFSKILSDPDRPFNSFNHWMGGIFNTTTNSYYWIDGRDVGATFSITYGLSGGADNCLYWYDMSPQTREKKCTVAQYSYGNEQHVLITVGSFFGDLKEESVLPQMKKIQIQYMNCGSLKNSNYRHTGNWYNQIIY